MRIPSELRMYQSLSNLNMRGHAIMNGQHPNDPNFVRQYLANLRAQEYTAAAYNQMTSYNMTISEQAKQLYLVTRLDPVGAEMTFGKNN